MHEVTLNDIITLMNERFNNIDKSIAEVKTDVKNIKLHLENVTDKNISIIAENVSSNNTRISAHDEDLMRIKDDKEITDVVLQIPNIIKKQK